MGLVAPSLPVVVHLRVPPHGRGTALAVVILGPEALVRGPGLEQGAVNAEVLPRDVAAQVGLLHHRREEAVGDLLLQQPLPVLAEGAVVEALGVDVQVQEELEEQVVPQPLAELPLAPDRVQGHQNRGLEQLLGRHAVPARGGVHGVELRLQIRQDCLHHRLDPPDRVVVGDQAVRRQGGQHRHLQVGGAAHARDLRKVVFDTPRLAHPSHLVGTESDRENQHPASGAVRAAVAALRAIVERSPGSYAELAGEVRAAEIPNEYGVELLDALHAACALLTPEAGMDEVLAAVSRTARAESDDPLREDAPPMRALTVEVMTLHASKGLTADYAVIVDAFREVLPADKPRDRGRRLVSCTGDS